MTACSVAICDRPVQARGLCLPHYKRAQKVEQGKPVRVALDSAIRSARECAVEGCEVIVRTNQALALCTTHAKRRRSGNLGAPRSVHQKASPCRFDGCDNKGRSFGLCDAHYAQQRKGQELRPLRRPKGRYVTKSGYAQVWRPDLGWTKTGWVMEHRVVMADQLGRDLIEGENVHHRNGVRHDNRPENLELWVSSQPSGQRVEDVVAHARLMVERYGDLVRSA